MKRFLSWLILPVSYIVVYLWFTAMYKLTLVLYNWLNGMSTAAIIVLVLIFGSVALALIFAPLYYGAPLTYAASEAVCPSSRGLRYKVFASGLFVLTCVSFVLSLTLMNTINIACIFVAIYCVILFLLGKTTSKQEDLDAKDGKMA